MSIKIFYKLAKDRLTDSGLSIEVKVFEFEEEVSSDVYSFSNHNKLSSAMLRMAEDILSLDKSFMYYYFDKKNNYIELENLMRGKKILISETDTQSDIKLNDIPDIKELAL